MKPSRWLRETTTAKCEVREEGGDTMRWIEREREAEG